LRRGEAAWHRLQHAGGAKADGARHDLGEGGWCQAWADGARHDLGERMSKKTTEAKLPGGGKAAEGPLRRDTQLRDNEEI